MEKDAEARSKIDSVMADGSPTDLLIRELMHTLGLHRIIIIGEIYTPSDEEGALDIEQYMSAISRVCLADKSEGEPEHPEFPIEQVKEVLRRAIDRCERDAQPDGARISSLNDD